jgi:hypothetical protein
MHVLNMILNLCLGNIFIARNIEQQNNTIQG